MAQQKSNLNLMAEVCPSRSGIDEIGEFYDCLALRRRSEKLSSLKDQTFDMPELFLHFSV